jgi:hypothetical protein
MDPIDTESHCKNVRRSLHDCAGDLMAAMLSATLVTERLGSEHHPAARDARALLESLRKFSSSLSDLRAALDGQSESAGKGGIGS